MFAITDACFEIQPNDEQDWLKIRQNGIGASESPVLFDSSDFTTPYGLYCIKKGLISGNNDTNDRMIKGIIYEPAHLQYYTEITGNQTYHNRNHVIIANKENPFIMFTPDGMVDFKGKRYYVEVKTTEDFKRWKDEFGVIHIPTEIQIQLQHQMMVSETTRILLLLNIGLTQYPIWVDRNESFINILRERIEQFKKCLDSNIEPEPQGDDTAILNKLFADKKRSGACYLPESYVTLDKQLNHYTVKLAMLRDKERRVETRRNAIQNQIKRYMIDNEVGILPNGVTYRLDVQKRKGGYRKTSKTLQLKRMGVQNNAIFKY